MGRRYKSPPWTSDYPDGPVEGVDTLNKVFFETPQVINVGTPVQPPTYSMSGGYNSTSSSSVVRLASSRILSICPERDQPAEVVYELSPRPTNAELEQYLKECLSFGIGRGAIVSRRYATQWRRENPTEWGIISYTLNQVPYSGDFTGPFNVLWFDPSSNAPKQEKAWAEDLILIHAMLPEVLLKTIIYNQMHAGESDG